MRVEVLSVGDELLTGDVADTNAGWLGRRLTAAGLRVGALTVVGDEEAEIRSAAVAALRRSGTLIVTGGLGPTSDDVTEDALTPLAGPGQPPTGAVATLPNPVGTAPGLRIETRDGPVYAVPGVPAEMTAMVEASVLPDLRRRAGLSTATVTRTLHVVLLSEPEVAGRLGSLEQAVADAGGPLRVAYLAAPGQIRVRLTATAETAEDAAARVAPWLAQARAELGDAVSGIDEPLEVTVHRLLADRGATIAVAESLTGGLVGATLTSMAGSSATFRGGVTAYATELKAELLGVNPGLLADRGPVDAGVAAQMAAGIRQRTGSTFGVATTGVAGPEPQDGHQPGTVHVAIAGPDGTRVSSPRLAGDRARIRALTVVHALDAARRCIAGLPPAAEDAH